MTLYDKDRKPEYFSIEETANMLIVYGQLNRVLIDYKTLPTEDKFGQLQLKVMAAKQVIPNEVLELVSKLERKARDVGVSSNLLQRGISALRIFGLGIAN